MVFIANYSRSSTGGWVRFLRAKYAEFNECMLRRASLWYSVTWICSQRLLIHLRGTSHTLSFSFSPSSSILLLTEIASENQSEIVFSQSLRSPNSLSRALRSSFQISNSKSQSNMYGLQDYPSTVPTELDVHVRVEHTVSVDQSGGYAREERWKPKSTWNSEL